MNIYTYVAARKPYFAKSLANKYGHELNKKPNLPLVLEQLVGMHGEQALFEILETHPDLDLFKEYFDKNKEEETKLNLTGSIVAEETKTSCNCENKSKEKENSIIEYLNITGADQRRSSDLVSNTNMMILAGAIVVAFAILNLKN
jgi:hypothetical protein